MRQLLIYDFYKLLCEQLNKLKMHCELLDYPRIEAGDVGAFDNLILRDLLKEAVNILIRKGVKVWIIIDNMDRYSYNEQTTGYECANYFTKEFGVRAVIPMRTYSYPGYSQHIGNTAVTLYPPNINEIMNKRINSLSKNSERDTNIDFWKLCKNLKNVTVQLKFLNNAISNVEDFQFMYKKVAEILAKNSSLIMLLVSLRNHNIRRITEDLGTLLDCGNVASYVMAELESQIDIPKHSSEMNKNVSIGGQYSVITTYLRGPYKHHRGTTDRYRINVVNLFDLPHLIARNRNRLLSFRVLQLIAERSTPHGLEGVDYEFLLEKLLSYGYDNAGIIETIRYFNEVRILNEIMKMRNWGNGKVKPEEGDKYVLTRAGHYYIRKFMKKYSLRYSEAMADVTRLPVKWFAEGKGSGRTLIWKNKNHFQMCNNSWIVYTDFIEYLQSDINDMLKIKYRNNLTAFDDFCLLTRTTGGFFYRATKAAHEVVKLYASLYEKEEPKEWGELLKDWNILIKRTQKLYEIRTNVYKRYEPHERE